ncbi:hypothetical protein [Gordonia liuliyuniae]|uniref:Uncharacterized protein n=1 Tax=Gordonia liuliyuniae TaxID=2911517 RepID=A0ABS9IV56_9ACTN|nr:hypothetical protein [Gordonia liuliyuniae]MCF8589447.1 hypothetical protein [Gordonia liuliyuniae]
MADSYLNSSGVGVGELRSEMGRIGAIVGRWLARVEPMSRSGTESIARVRFESVGYDAVVQPLIKGSGMQTCG